MTSSNDLSYVRFLQYIFVLTGINDPLWVTSRIEEIDMKIKMLFLLVVLTSSSAASAQLPSVTLSVVGNNIPLLGNLGIQNLVVGGPTLIALPAVVRPSQGPRPSGAPSLTVSLLAADLPLLPDLGVENLVLGGPNGLEFPVLIGTDQLAVMVGGLVDNLGGALLPGGVPGLNGRPAILDALPGLDSLPISPAPVLQLVDPGIVGGVLTGVGNLLSIAPPGP